MGPERQRLGSLAANVALLAAVRVERERRIHTGEAAKEAAQWHLAKAPTVLGGILTDEQVSPRHRIEAAKELRQAAGNSPDAASEPKEKYIISINFGSGQEVYREFDVTPRKEPDDGEAP